MEHTVKFKLDKKDILFPFIIFHKRRSHIVSSYVKESKNWPNEERVGFLSAFKIADCLRVRKLKFKSIVSYVLATLFLGPVSLLRHIIQKDFSEPDSKRSLLAKTLSIETFLKVD